MADQSGGGGQNVGGGTIVALQPYHFGVGKIFFKTQDVFDFGAAPRINRLVVIADAAQVAIFLAKQAQKQILGDVGVLILIDHDVSETFLILVQNFGIRHQDAQRIEQDVAEVDAIEFEQTGLILFINFGDDVGAKTAVNFIHGQSFVFP